MKKFAVFSLLTLLVFLGIGRWQTENLKNWVSEWQGRRMIYPESEEITKYPGEREVSGWSDDVILVSPIGEGRPFFTTLEKRGEYPSDQFEILDVPAQAQLVYAVGRFVGWEDIVGSQDKYLLLNDSVLNVVHKYRIAFEKSELFKEETTSLSVEDVSRGEGSIEQNRVESVGVDQTIEIGYETMRRIIKRGDSVVLLPVWDLPQLSKKDEGGNYLVSVLILRRAGGREKVDKEINRLGAKK